MVGDRINDALRWLLRRSGRARRSRRHRVVEAADVVLTVDRIDRLGGGRGHLACARRTATQAAWLGMGLCFVAMGAAALGFLPPAAGAILQEGIDVLAMAWALRVGLLKPRGPTDRGARRRDPGPPRARPPIDAESG